MVVFAVGEFIVLTLFIVLSESQGAVPVIDGTDGAIVNPPGTVNLTQIIGE